MHGRVVEADDERTERVTGVEPTGVGADEPSKPTEPTEPNEHEGPPEPPRRPEPPELTQLYRDRWAPMVRVAHLITGSSAVAPDLVQDAFLKVAPKLAQLDSPPAYLRTVVVNECRGWLRRQEVERRHQQRDEPPLVIPPDVDEVWAALDGLSDRQRAAIVLRFYEDLPFDDIARVLDCRVGTAKSLVHRGVAALKEVVVR